jgi:choline dehydrogenase
LCQDLLSTSDLAGFVARPLTPEPADLRSPAESDAWVKHNVRGAFHVVGTCQMGSACDPMSVVDGRLRVHGIAGLRVADLSIAPNVVRANTNATAVMVGERAAELILERQ